MYRRSLNVKGECRKQDKLIIFGNHRDGGTFKSRCLAVSYFNETLDTINGILFQL